MFDDDITEFSEFNTSLIELVTQAAAITVQTQNIASDAAREQLLLSFVSKMHNVAFLHIRPK